MDALNPVDQLPDGRLSILLLGGKEATIDARDLPKVAQLRWQLLVQWGKIQAVARARIGSHMVTYRLGNYLLGLSFAEQVTYKDGNPLNCSRSNMVAAAKPKEDKPAPTSASTGNRFKYFDKDKQRWVKLREFS